MATAPTAAVQPRSSTPLTRLIRPIPAWGWILAGGILSLLVVECVVEGSVFGTGSRATDLESVTYLTLMWSAALLGLAGAWVRRDLGGWGLIGVGLLATALGDTYYQFWVDPVNGAYPSVADVLYLLQYPLVIVGLRNLGRRSRRGPMPFAALLTPLLGLATLWWWIALDPVTGSLEGTTAARLTTIAYPFLDLLLICSALIALGSVGWRAGTSFATLIAGATIVGIADSVYAAQVATGTVPDLTLINALWPIGTLLMASAAWLADRREVSSEPNETRLELFFAVGAIAIALVVLVWDHFQRFNAVTVVLAFLTLTAAAVRLVLLYQEGADARREALRAERERGWIEGLHSTAVAAALDCVITVDEKNRVVGWNPAATRTFGYSIEEALGQDVADLIVTDALREQYDATFRRLVAGENDVRIGHRFEWLAKRSDGVVIPVEMAFTRTETDPPTYTSIIRDISERKHREEERERLARMVLSAEDAMVSCTLDGKVIAWNPAAERIYGYAAGEIVGQSQELVVPDDRRDELGELREIVMQGESTSLETQRVRKNGEIIDVLLQVFPVRDERGRLTGYSAVSRDITDRRRREAEIRRNRERQAWRSEIEDALEHDTFEFHRQPVLELRSGQVSHHELLIRMRIAGELVPPVKFLPHVEGSPLMTRIDRWAIGRGIELAAENPVAINLSATSLGDPGIVSAVENGLQRTGARAEDVSFEITETAAAEDLDSARSLVGALRGLGCAVALDDFGTGYGSFTYLARLPVTTLKIDMSFIRDLADSPEDLRVVRSIVAVAQNFGLTTVAEGVEDIDTLNLLRGVEVDEVQGYLIGRPQPDWTLEADLALRRGTPEAG
jgi:PAS domain S-box-containing protein